MQQAMVEQLMALGRDFGARGWLPGGSGNFSARLADGRILLTATGRHKARLRHEDFLPLALDADLATVQPRPSAEALLHVQRYLADANIGCVLHTHSPAATVLSRQAGDTLELADYELLKAFPGVATHAGCWSVPILENDQDMRRLAQSVVDRGIGPQDLPLFLIRGHGLYTWGASIESARDQLEAAEFLLECELLGKKR